ncbi:hypothetical protein C3L33_17523, partial [Rhododendron williamsianum]
MSLEFLHHVLYRQLPKPPVLRCSLPSLSLNFRAVKVAGQKNEMSCFRRLRWAMRGSSQALTPLRYRVISASLQPLDLTEDNVKRVLVDAQAEASYEFGQIFDVSAGMTGVAQLVELDGPFVKISLKGRFWHKRSTVLDRLANYLKQRIPEILEVDIEDEKQLDDSPENF